MLLVTYESETSGFLEVLPVLSRRTVTNRVTNPHPNQNIVAYKGLSLKDNCAPFSAILFNRINDFYLCPPRT
jgi:hypothetical protein